MERPERARSPEEATTRLKAGAEGPSLTPAEIRPDPAPPRSPSVESPAVDPLVGLVVSGRYKLLAPLAVGGMGSVYRAEQLNLKRRVAVKVMVEPGAELIERYRREAVALSEVSHPAIVEIFDFDTFGEGSDVRGCLVMAFIDGKDLADYLADQPARCLEPAEVRSLILPVVSALVELHANGILHRDIKPDNIVRFVRADGRAGVKLVDFGIARRQLDQGMTASGYVLGTPPYLPPETMLGEKHTPLSDIYALGATMFELLTGTPPYGSGSAAEIMQKALASKAIFPPDLEETPLGQLLRRMLSRRPSQRPDAMEVLQGLEALRCEDDRRSAGRVRESRQAPTRQLAPVARPDPSEPVPGANAGAAAAPAQAHAHAHAAAAPGASVPSAGSDSPLPWWLLLLLGALVGGGAVALGWALG